MGDISRLVIEVRRHSIKDGDKLTPEGAKLAFEMGQNEYANATAPLVFYHTPKIRGRQTAVIAAVGSGRDVGSHDSMPLGLSHTNDPRYQKPEGDYGPEWIMQALENNPWLRESIQSDMHQYFQDVLFEHDEGTIVGITHGPKVEIAAASLLNILNLQETADLAANPLEGFRLDVDRHQKSRNFDRICLHYQGSSTGIPLVRLTR